MDKVIEFLSEHWQWVTLGVTIASAIAASTKTEWDNKIVNFVSKVVNVIALNIGKAKNADAEKK